VGSRLVLLIPGQVFLAISEETTLALEQVCTQGIKLDRGKLVALKGTLDVFDVLRFITVIFGEEGIGIISR
jgi:hypothetical protein